VEAKVVKHAAIEALKRRQASQPVHIGNSSLRSGDPMYFYCQSCGWLADTLPEDYFLAQPRRLCSECQAMKDRGWL
jgi:hypothetical protein